MKEFKLSPPWVVFYNKIKALFERDNDVRIVFNESEPSITLHVYGIEKARAIERLLCGKEVVFGDVIVDVTVIPEKLDTDSMVDVFKAAFKNNPVLSEVRVVESPIGNYTYAMFDSNPVYLQNDDISSPYGYSAKLYEDIVKDVINTDAGIFICSDRKTFSF